MGVLAVNPLGRGSVTTTFWAGLGPLLVMVMVNVPVCPTFNGPLPVLVMETSALGLTTMLVVVVCEFSVAEIVAVPTVVPV